MNLIFDEGKETEKKLTVNNINERPLANNFFGSYSTNIVSDKDFPDIEGFQTGDSFSDFRVIDGTIIVPVSGKYNTISDFSTQYDSARHVFSANITLTYREVVGENE